MHLRGYTVYISKFWCVYMSVSALMTRQASDLGVPFDRDLNVEAHFKYHSKRFLDCQEYCISKAISVKGIY